MTGSNGNRSELWPEHHSYLKVRGVDDDVIAERSCFSAPTKAALQNMGFGRNTPAPALVLPLWTVVGECDGYQIRPDRPRVNGTGRALKFEVPHSFRPRLDVHPRTLPKLADPTIPIWITEGIPKADALVSAGVPAVAMLGVWMWTGDTLADFEYLRPKGRTFYVCFDSDVMLKPSVHQALARLGDLLRHRGANVAFVYLPDGPDGRKQGVDDFLAAGGTVADLLDHHTTSELRRPAWEQVAEPEPQREPFENRTVGEVVAVIGRHLKLTDPSIVYAVVGAYVANRLPGDPVWLGIVGGSSRGKTELVMAISKANSVIVESAITGPSALLSATAQKERTADATGGILRRIGAQGVIALKDFTTVLEMHRDARAQLLAALREVYDGSWSRSVGVDGGRTITWAGKVGLIFGVTTAIDTHHAVMSQMGERFLLARVPVDDDLELVDSAITNIGNEQQMRDEIATTVAGLLDHVDYDTPAPPATGDTYLVLRHLARFVARARSPVIWSYNAREIELVGDPEGPPRLYKALDRLLAGMTRAGVPADEAVAATVKIGMDSMPKGRRVVLDAVIDGRRTTSEIGQRAGLPTDATRRRLAELVAHDVLTRRTATDDDDAKTNVDLYELSTWAAGDLAVIVGEKSDTPPPPEGWGYARAQGVHTPADVSPTLLDDDWEDV